ncbi:unnamed protein product [Durusdinium trenchii]|uniref:Uncharacterized protein n=2 Tax=Durusdinium trenchii TaxID=1381693 RepID=A0ABP0LVP3_9DINO
MMTRLALMGRCCFSAATRATSRSLPTSAASLEKLRRPWALSWSLPSIASTGKASPSAQILAACRFSTSTSNRHLKTTRNSFGSYGGMLSSWMRAKYPELIFAAVASSAPVHFDRVGGSFFRMVTDAAEAVSPGCAQRVRRGFAAATSQSRQHLRAAFSLCNDDVRLDELILWARNAFVTVAMGNYPYATNLFGQGLKAWPLKSACEQKGLNALEFLAKAVGSYYNATGGVICHNITEEYRDCADQTGCGNLHSAWGRSWDVEACRQIVYYTSTNNVTDMFPAKEWGPRQLSQYCKQTWNITPETFWFGPWLSKIQQSSHIIFTYGLSDPWRGGGVLNSSRRSDLVSLKIREAGHIYDLAASHPDDLPDVRKVRQRIIALLREWLASGEVVV